MRSRTDFVKLLVVPCCLLLLCIASGAAAQTSLGSAFSYQGQLRSNGNPMTATCDFQFKLCDAALGGNQVGSTLKLSNVQVQNGLFNVELDFGRYAFSSTRWLEVAVTYPAGTSSTTTLAPRHKLIPTPYALYAAGVADGAITSDSLGAGAVTNTKIAAGAVTSSKIAPQAVANAALAPQAVTNSSLANGAVNGRTIADGSVATTHLVDYAVTSVKIADNAVMTGHILDNAVTSGKIQDLAVTNAKISSVAWTKITGAPVTYPPSGTAGGALTGNYPNPALAANIVTSTVIANNAVTSNKIASVAWTKITGAPAAYPPSGTAGGVLSGNYPNPALAANAVTSMALADNAVTSRTLPDGSILDRKILSVSWNKVTSVPLSLPPGGVAGGDLTGAYPNPAIANGAVTDAKINSVAWNKITGAPTTYPPDGAAGGALTGTYPNPLLANQSVTSAVLADRSVTAFKLANGAVTSPTLALNTVTTSSIINGAVTDEKIEGVSWSKIYDAPGTYPPNGVAGGDLTGSYPNPAIANGAVTDAKINSVAWGKITGAPATYPPDGTAGGALTGTYPNPLLANNAVTSPALADSAVTSRALASLSVTTTKLADGAVTSRTLAVNAVTSASIQNGAVTDEKIEGVSWSKVYNTPGTYPPSGAAGGNLTGAYPNPSLAANSVTSSTILNGAVTDDKIAGVSWNKIFGAPVTYPPDGAAGGALTGTYPNPTLADNAVTSAVLADNAVTSRALALNAVTSASIFNGAVTSDKILSVEWAKITDSPDSMAPGGPAGGALAGTYPNPTLAANAVTSTVILNGAVTDDKIAGVSWSKIYGAPITYPPTGAAGGDLAGAYPNPTIVNGAVNENKIADGAVTNAKINSVAWSKVTGRPAALPPSGPAGGILAGAYPNPGFASGAITSAALATAAVDASKIALPLLFEGTTAAATDSILQIIDYGPGRAIYGLSYSDHSGVRGDALGLNGYGVYGLADNGTGAKGVSGESADGYGVYGASTTGYGVYGSNIKTANFGYLGTQNEGALGEALATDGTGVTGISNIGAAGNGVAGYANDGNGVYGINQASGNYGLLGTPTGGAEAYSTLDTAVYAVTNTGIAIYGRADGHGQAGHFDGSVIVSGNIDAGGNINGGGDLNITGSKNFRIDHPLDPANKVLVHAAVEGPERMNIYNGNVVTNEQGLASVELPAYFEALNADPRYQLTVIGQFAQAIIAQEIKENRFTIRTDKPGVKVSWQVIGIRKDAYALAHPFTAEQPKTAPAQEGR